jgi:hypothetical protein
VIYSKKKVTKGGGRKKSKPKGGAKKGSVSARAKAQQVAADQRYCSFAFSVREVKTWNVAILKENSG